MAITASALFGATSAAASATWKPPAASAAASLEGAWKATTTKGSTVIQDKVEVGALQKSLKGVAADVFGALGTKAQAHLEGLVKSGDMTAEDVSLGLRSMATSSVHRRFLKERPRDGEDVALEAQRDVLAAAAKQTYARVEAAKANINAVNSEASKGLEQSTPEAQAARAQRISVFQAEIESAEQDHAATVGGKPGELLSKVYARMREKENAAYEATDFGDTADGFLNLDDEKGREALQRMGEFGFKREMFINGLNKFTANVDIPGVGRGTYEEDPEFEPAAADPEPEETIASDAVTMLEQAAQAASQTAASKGMGGMGKVSKEARDSLDAGYRALSAKGKADGFANGDEAAVSTVFAGLDRRSLFAIASNGGGLFSETEQKAAQNLMAEQQAEAMKKADPTGADKAAGFKAAVEFLDNVGDEEKASANWSVQRAANQLAYEKLMKAEDKPSTMADSASPVVRMIKGAMEAKAQQGDSFESMAGGGYVKDLSAMPLFRNGMPKVSGYLTMPVDVRV